MLAARRVMQIGLPVVNPISYVVNNAAVSTSTISAASFAFSPSTAASVGHKVILFVKTYAGTASSQVVTSVTDSVGNTWTVDAVGPRPDSRTSAAICSSNLTTALGTSATITVTYSAAIGSSSSVYYVLDEWSFPQPLKGVDKAGTGSTSYAKSGSAQISAATTGVTDLIVSGTGFASSPGTVTGPSGYTTLRSGIASLYYLLPATSQRFVAGLSWTTSANASQVIVAYSS